MPNLNNPPCSIKKYLILKQHRMKTFGMSLGNCNQADIGSENQRDGNAKCSFKKKNQFISIPAFLLPNFKGSNPLRRTIKYE